MSKKRRLGKGLGALLGETGTGGFDPAAVPMALARDGQPKIQLNKISPNRYQPRKNIDPESVSELASSIKAQGLIQPLVVN
ncbi:ParB N-terminal domain-containing protein, partial [Gemmatimonadota bacterium]